MFGLSFKYLIHNRSRFMCTVIGFFVSSIIVVFGMYFLHVSDGIANENFKDTLAQQRILINEVLVSGVDYHETEEGFVEDNKAMTSAVLFDIFSSEGVTSVCSVYEIQEPFEVMLDGKELIIEMPLAVNPEYDIFSRALLGSLSVNGEFKAIVAGEELSQQNMNEVLISETTVCTLGLSAEDVLGKKMTISGPSKEVYVVTIVGVYSHELSRYYRTPLIEFTNINVHSAPSFLGVEFVFHSGLIEQIQKDNNPDKGLYPSYVLASFDTLDKIPHLIEKMYVKHSLSTVSDYMRFYSDIENRTRQASLFLVLGTIIFVLAMFMNLNTMLINISEQKSFIKLLSLMGYSKVRIHTIHMIQSMIYGVTGTAAGFLIAYIVCAVIGVVTESSFDEVMVDSDVFLLPIQNVLLVMIAMVAVNMIVSFFISLISRSSTIEKRNKK